MFEAYAIGVTLKLHNLISPQLVLLSKEFEKLDALTLSLNKSLGKISIDSSGLRSLATSTNTANRAFERASLSAANFQRHLSAIHATGTAMGGARLPPAGGGGGGRSPGGGFHGGNIHMGAGGVGLGTVGMAAGDWFWPLAATGALAVGGKSLFESAKDLDTERQKFRLFGMSDAQNQEAFKYAANMHIYGSTQTENLRNFREAQGVFREAGLSGSSALEGAKLAAPILSKLNALDSSLDDDSAARSKASNMAMLRYVESVGGLKSAAEFNRIADVGYRLKVGSGDTVDWQQLQQFQRRAGSYGINISGEGLARLEPSISTLSGSTAGVALATGGGRLQGIVRGLQVAVIDELLKNGVWDRRKVELNSKGGISRFLDPNGPLSGNTSKLLSENPEQFYETIIRPIYKKMNLDAAGVIRQNVLIYGRTGGALANEWEKQLATIARASDAFNKTKGLDAATNQLPKSLTGQEQEFEAAWTDFKTKFGTQMLPFFTGILKAGSAILRVIPDSTGSNLLHGLIGATPFGAVQGISDLFSGAPSSNRNVVAGKGGSGLTVHTQVNLDGQKIATAVTKVQAKAANAPQTGITTFDSLAGAIPAGGLGH